MAEADEEDWLYGNEEKEENKDNSVTEKTVTDDAKPQEESSDKPEETTAESTEQPITNGTSETSPMETNENEEKNDEKKEEVAAPAVDKVIKIDDDSDSDDDVQVTIGAIIPGSSGNNESAGNLPGQGSGNRSYYRNPVQVVGTQKTSVGKGIDLTAPGNINGQAVMDVNLDSLEDKPWRKPGADISDYFNYGFNEVTWKFYCDKQKRLRDGDTSAFSSQSLMSTPSARVSTALTNILSKFDKSKSILSSPVITQYDNTVRTISTLQVTRRKEDMLNQLKLNQSATLNSTPTTTSAPAASIPPVAAPTSSSLFTVPPPAVNGPPPPIHFDPTKPPPSILGLPMPGFPPPGGILPPSIRPPGTEFIQLPPVSGGAFLRPPGTYMVPNAGQPQQPFFNPDDSDDPMHRNRSDSQHRQSDGNYPSDEEGRYRGSRRDYDRDRDRYGRRSDYRDDHRDRSRDYDRDRDRDRGRDRDRDRDRERDRDRDRESRRRRDESPSRHKSSRRKHEEDDSRHSSKHKKSKKYKHDKEKGDAAPEEENAAPEEQKA
uniref:Pre-mRNA 3'-end-processing factor FIP1 n=1 Tax=Phallusia mammillata TaxID=59560 RepID=A0A6F9DCU8_9ASCI|nr:pre-mRNA 3'-end-processing factor FIP1 [Phallusia mammillata]